MRVVNVPNEKTKRFHCFFYLIKNCFSPKAHINRCCSSSKAVRSSLILFVIFFLFVQGGGVILGIQYKQIFVESTIFQSHGLILMNQLRKIYLWNQVIITMKHKCKFCVRNLWITRSYQRRGQEGILLLDSGILKTS